jgi:uncharacterized protein (TIGR02145 family)
MKTSKMQNRYNGKIRTRLVALVLVLLVFLPELRAQMTIGDVTEPKEFSVLELISNTKAGLRLPQLTAEQRQALEDSDAFKAEMTGKAKGLTIFNITNNCMETWSGKEWISMCGETCEFITNVTISGNKNLFSIGSTMSLSSTIEPANATLPISYQWYKDDTPIPGATSATYTKNIIAGDNGIYSLKVSNACTTDISSNLKEISLFPEAEGSGTMSGKTCFDIAFSNDNENGCAALPSRAPHRTDFENTAIQDPEQGITGGLTSNPAYSGIQVYTFKPTGNVSNVRFTFIDQTSTAIHSLTANGNYTGNITSGTACKATVVYKSSLNETLKGKTRDDAVIVDICVIYNDKTDGTGTDRMLKLKATLQDCACCGAYKSDGTWLNFMCHNLGADETADPFTHTFALQGNWYVFGNNTPARIPKDGSCSGESVASPTPISGNVNWTDDPCPPGWRLPTISEWDSVRKSEFNDISKGEVICNATPGWYFGSLLFLPFQVSFNKSNGFTSTRARYWSSTSSDSSKADSFTMNQNKTTFTINSNQNAPNGKGIDKGHRNVIRCVAE